MPGADPAQLPWQRCRAPSLWPASPSPVETFPVGSLGPGPGCEEPFARYLQFIISHVITSLVLTVLGSLTNTSGAAATVAMLLGWGWGCVLPEGCAGTPGPGRHRPLAPLRQRAARGFAPQAHTAALAGAELPGVPRAAVSTSPRGQHATGECPLLLPARCQRHCCSHGPLANARRLARSLPQLAFLRNRFLLLTAVLRKPSKKAKHCMQNKIQSKGLNYTRAEKTSAH